VDLWVGGVLLVTPEPVKARNERGIRIGEAWNMFRILRVYRDVELGNIRRSRYGKIVARIAIGGGEIRGRR
jgi:hypothetical protein